jgi:hypothetical protein
MHIHYLAWLDSIALQTRKGNNNDPNTCPFIFSYRAKVRDSIAGSGMQIR